jgi:hypothetical protein
MRVMDTCKTVHMRRRLATLAECSRRSPLANERSHTLLADSGLVHNSSLPPVVGEVRCESARRNAQRLSSTCSYTTPNAIILRWLKRSNGQALADSRLDKARVKASVN